MQNEGVNTNETLEQVIQRAGSVAAVARSLKVSSSTLCNWRIRGIPEEYCPAIERIDLGRCSVEELRPDVSWCRVKDKAWPHPAGRPLVDHAAETKA